jgi:PST family polysaccharide transporter
MNLALGICAWAVLTFGAVYLGEFFRSPDTARLLPVTAFGFIIGAFATVPTALLSRDMRYRDSATSEWLATFVDSGMSIGFAYAGFSYWSLIYGTLIGDASRAVVRSWMAGWWPRIWFSREAVNEIFSFGAGIYVRNLLDYCTQNLDNLIVGRVLGISALGFYDKAFNTMTKFTAKIHLAGPGVSFRIFALIHEDPERFRRAYRKVMLSITIVGYPVLTGMIVTGPQLIDVLFGQRWLSAVLPFQILCGAGAMQLLNTYASSATQAKGQIWSEVRRQTVFLVTLVGAVYFFSRWGLAGAAAGVLFANAVMTVLLQTMVRRLADLRWSDIIVPQGPALACSTGLLGVLLVTRMVALMFFPRIPSLALLFTCFATSAVYYAAFVLLAPFAFVREIVHETAQDFAPGLVKRLTWLAPAPKEISALAGQ